MVLVVKRLIGGSNRVENIALQEVKWKRCQIWYNQRKLSNFDGKNTPNLEILVLLLGDEDLNHSVIGDKHGRIADGVLVDL